MEKEKLQNVIQSSVLLKYKQAEETSLENNPYESHY